MRRKSEGKQRYAGLLVILALIVGGCQGNRGTESDTTPAAPETAVSGQASPTQQVAVAPTAVATPTEPPAATSTEPPPTPTAKPTHTPTSTRVPPTDTPTPTNTSTPVPVDAVVTAPQLNVRSGPGTAFGAVAALVKDDAMEVIGQSNIGLGIGLLGTQVGILSMGQNTDLLYLSMCLCSFSFMIGGIPQWLLLRSKVPKAWIWVVASPLVLFLSYLAMWFTSLRIFGMFFYSSEDLGAEVLASLGDVLTNSGLSLGRHIPWFDVPIMIFAGGIAGGIVYGLSAGQILLRLSKYPMTEPVVLEASISTATPSQVQETLPGDMPSRVELDD